MARLLKGRAVVCHWARKCAPFDSTVSVANRLPGGRGAAKRGNPKGAPTVVHNRRI